MKEKKDKLLSEELHLLDDFEPTTYEVWRKAVDKLLKGKPYEKILQTDTYENITLEPMYRKEDIEQFSFPKSLPGFPAYARDYKYLGYIDKPWLISQKIDEWNPVNFNQALKKDMNKGLTEINLRINPVSFYGSKLQSNKKSDFAGLIIRDADDLKKAFADIKFDNLALRINAGERIKEIITLFYSCFQDKCENISISFEFDFIALLLENGKTIKKPDNYIEELIELINFFTPRFKSLKLISVDGEFFHNTGASAVEEVALIAASLIYYLREFIKKDLNIDNICKYIETRIGIGSNYFMEIAKIRALRLVWGKIIEEFGGDEKSKQVYIHAVTSKSNKTVFDPYVNMLRTTTEAFSAVIGGIESLTVGDFDELIRKGSDFSRRVARNQQIILREEAHLNKVVDPAGGSWFIEYLTNEIAKNSWKILQAIEKENGMLEALTNNIPQTMIQETVERRKKAIAKRKDVFVGTNYYANLDEKELEKPDQDIKAQIKSYLKNKEDGKTLASNNQIDELLDAFQNGQSLKDLNDTKNKDAEGPTVKTLDFFRGPELFEKIRCVAEIYKDKNKKRPTVFLANLGSINEYKARADFSAEFMRVGGFDIITSLGLNSPEKAAVESAENKADIVVICSTDKNYPEMVPKFTNKLNELKKETIIVLAGYPKNHIEKLKKAGIDEFISLKANAINIFNNIWKRILGKDPDDYLQEKTEKGGSNE